MNGSMLINASSSAVAPRVDLVAPVLDMMFTVGSLGLSPGDTGVVYAVPPFAVVKSTGFKTNAKWPRSVWDEGMVIAFSLILSWKRLSVVYDGFDVIVEIFGMFDVAVVKVTAMLCGVVVVMVLILERFYGNVRIVWFVSLLASFLGGLLLEHERIVGVVVRMLVLDVAGGLHSLL